ncbi:adenine-specific DNA methyltransferase, partial [human gut metagenome]
MSIEELCALPVADLAAPDSALFLWATFPQLPEALRLIEAWGFTYKSVAFVWLKKNKKADSLVLRPWLLDKGQCRNLPAGDQGTSKAAGCQHSSIH